MGKVSAVAKAVVRITFKLLPAIGGIVILVLVIAWLSGMFEPKVAPGLLAAQSVERPKGTIDQVHEVTKDYIFEAVGTLKAATRTVISSKILATIERIHVSAGDQVKAGDLLIELADEEYQARVRQAEQALRAAEATRAEAEKAFARAKELLERNAIAKSQYDAIKAKLDVARAEEARAKQAVTEAKVLLSYAKIRAPKRGRIVDRLAEPGDTARPGEPLLVLYDAASLRLEAPVPEHLALKLHVGQHVPVYIDALQKKVEGVIDEIVPQAEALSRSFLVKTALQRSEQLYEGMFGRLLIPAGQRRHLCLATAAIEKVGQLEFVYVVHDDGSVERRLIKTGRLGLPGRIEVLSGLRAGEKVIVLEKNLKRQKESAEQRGTQ